jgi:acylglycerol lipase
MKTEKGCLAGQKGLQLYYRGWLPDVKVRATIIIVHGVAEHSGRYTAIAQHSAVAEAYDRDPLVFRGKITARLGIELLWQSRRLENRLSQIQAPILILHGQDDLVCNPKAANLIISKISSKDKSVKIYPGLYHEILNEPEQKTVFMNISDWLSSRI